MHDLSLFSNEELLDLAEQQNLIDDYSMEGNDLLLYLEGTRLILSPSQLRVFLSGMLWGTRSMDHLPAANPNDEGT